LFVATKEVLSPTCLLEFFSFVILSVAYAESKDPTNGVYYRPMGSFDTSLKRRLRMTGGGMTR
jgi:hypothetical protein